jgi:carbamoyl-phosphate synthase large subunit
MGVNVLISSVSKKVPLVKSVRKAVEKIGRGGALIGADSNPECIGSYFVDHFWKSPKLNEISPEEFISYCQFYNVNSVIPTRDGELLYYAAHKEIFAEQGIQVMVSGKEEIEICTDKLKFYQTITGLGFPGIETSLALDELECETYVVKERYGAGSRSIGLNLGRGQAAKHSKKLDNPIYQPYIGGEEISVDLYLDKSGKTKGVIARKRDLVVDGESQITTTFRDSVIEDVCSRIAEELGLYGHVMFQIITSFANGVHYIMECNPRFGGASPLSLEMGLDSFYWFFLECLRKDLSNYSFARPVVEKRMIRYPEDLVLPWNTVV